MPDKSINCDEAKILMMGLLDSELTKAQEIQINEHLQSCSLCSREFESYSELKKETSNMKLKKLPEMYWDDYWQHIYNRLERGIGWIVFSIGLIIITVFAGIEITNKFFLDSSVPIMFKFGVAFAGIGGIVLLISVLREKLMVMKVDKYRSVKR